MSDLLRTSLYTAHAAAHARFVPFAGWEMPVQYAGVLTEVKAVRERVGLFDVSHMGRVRVRGGDAPAFLQRMVVSDIARLSESGGEARYSLFCLEAGGVLDDIIVYRFSAGEFIVVVNASNREKDLSWMRHHAGGFNVRIEDETTETALIAVQGPEAMPLLDSLADRTLSRVRRFGFTDATVSGVRTMAARTGYTGEDGMELFCTADDAPRLWEALTAAGATPCGLGARDTLRIEAALPLYGHEMDEHTSPYEARLGWTVKLDKPADFLGRTTLAALKDSPPRRILAGIEMDGRAIPREGYVVRTGDEVIGHVTSGTFSPTRGKGIALVRIDARRAAPGNAVDVIIRDQPHAARTLALPFYKNV
ncbi:MAG: glycine cleavage system aminomethyltransferase GcvT [Capsulimonadales bacterium]|nr:glycine cleavage system aminomethyltransferase GcvT [Capsulimonadales bacterium]